MCFEAETVVIGGVAALEYSIYDFANDLWLDVGADGGLYFGSRTPVSLRTLFPIPDAGSEKFAAALLNWIRESAGTGEIVDDHWVNMADTEANRAGLFAFNGIAPVAVPTGLAFNWEFRAKGIIFEVRGEPDIVDDFTAAYALEFPAVMYGTSFAEHLAPEGLKCVRICRNRLFD